MWGNSKDRIDSEAGSSDDVRIIQKKFIADMSYEIRNPLNEICGITEIAIKNLEREGDPELLKTYLEIIRDSGFELQRVIDERFREFEDEEGAKLKSIDRNEENARYSDEERRRVLNNKRILVAEDNETSGLIAKDLLNEYGAIVTVCTDGKSTVDLFLSSIAGSYDIILMDIIMPGMDGYEATRRIRQSEHQQAKSIPIIAMTAEAFAADIQNALSAGMNAHISKPVNIDKMVTAIKKAII